MNQPPPLVSICMLAYNVGPFVAQAIQGVLNQVADFRFELIIGEDCSEDDTRAICAEFAALYPAIIRLLPSERNLGIAGNAARTIRECRGKYLAICDGDDIWHDAGKLRRQVSFLETNPDFGLSFTDVLQIDENGGAIHNPAPYRAEYASGAVFFQLLQGNFINNSSVVVQKDLLKDHVIDEDPRYFTHDYFMWMHCAVRTKFHYDDTPSVSYRRHTGGVTRSKAQLLHNRYKQQLQLFTVLEDFCQHYREHVTPSEKAFIFKKMLSLLYRRPGTPDMKRRVLRRMPRYFPGLRDFWNIIAMKMIARANWETNPNCHEQPV